ncbi:MAG: KpsF/GutQ family sugar-phosphate isomerase [Elusimicrobia bacterium]|jgi:arabinose-5-phosphate isomerase|nr:KpsF/GutQ family sugar-phosphate isomerase [Elusimicrobiota bacterium]
MKKPSPQSAARWLARARRTLLIESRAVAEQARHLDRSFLQAAERLIRTRGRVVVMGIGKSGLIGRKLAATLSSTGTASFFVHPTEGLHGDVGMLLPGDTVLALSHSGETEELKKILGTLRTLRVFLIAMTGRPRSPLGRAAQVVINTAVSSEACPFNITPTASTTAMLALGDALALLVMEMRGFGREDFARLHPAGTLGKKLTLRVGDLMRKGSDNPLVLESRRVDDALAVMTKTRLGAASVVDKRGRLVGVFTDGDLRRKLQEDPALLTRTLSSVMTRRPRTLSPEELASDVAILFRKFGLDNFPVVDGRKRPVGVLDEKDLLEEGLVS